MKRLIASLLVLLALAGAANAIGLGLNRIGKLGALGKGSAASPPPGCAGVINASAGCPLPMLGS